MYEHESYLKGVAEEDRDHVDFMLRKLDDHCMTGSPVGDFLTAVLVGDLSGAVAHADDTNGRYLALYSKYCYNQLPTEHQGLLRPIVRDLLDVIKQRGWVTRGQVAEASNTFRTLLISVLNADAEKKS